MIMCNTVTSQSHRIEGGTTDEVFQEQCLLWARGAVGGVVQHLLHAQEYINSKGRDKTKKSIIGLL